MKAKSLQQRRLIRVALLFLLMTTGMMKSLAQPQGAVNGLFSVSSTKQVYFSQGNLQYQASSTETWQFAVNPWDYYGNNRDLFIWKVNSYWSSIAISNGGNQANLWRMLTKNEWEYVINTRHTASGIRYARAKVNNVEGVILLPDDWRTSYYPLTHTNSWAIGYNNISASQWNTLEQHGAVFLPAAGYHNGTSLYCVGLCGYYWSSTTSNSSNAYNLFFEETIGIGSYKRSTRQSVRLVCDAYTITATASPSAGGTITGAGAYYENGTCTLTATANTGYTFVNWTKNGSQVSTSPTYSFTVSGNASYVANFTLNSYEVTASANPVMGGIISGSGTYNHGATCTLTATANEGYTFINWTKNGEEISTEATYSFTVTENVAFVANFEANAISQTIELSQGWNWFSTYIEAENPVAMLQLLEVALGENGLYIESSELLSTEYLDGEWIGDLEEVGITNEQMYLIQTSDGCTIQLHGMVANPTNHEITIHPEWNWIGYLCSEEMTIAEALAGFVPEDGDQIESMEGYAEYIDGEWLGLSTLKPGQGFLYYSNSATTKTFTFPSSAK